MERTKEGFYQTAVLGVPPNTASLSRRIDLVIGSARKGQTYLYWGKNDRLLQLPVSYWVAPGKWANSPGFMDEDINFGRPVTPRCLECHASYFESVAERGAGNRYNRANYVLGISCEKCHGPGREHVARQLPQAAKPSGQAVINPAKLSRDRQIEACALCHAGVGVGKAPPFSYVPGKPLGDYLTLSSPDP
ncbi:MAG TPA: multiheme c-type cytochrome, partial [Pyrinomonadaceae bacterium]|nr:multiheme c-type cytochrome [Pyrinomonadaceae bacterium]